MYWRFWRVTEICFSCVNGETYDHYAMKMLHKNNNHPMIDIFFIAVLIDFLSRFKEIEHKFCKKFLDIWLMVLIRNIRNKTAIFQEITLFALNYWLLLKQIQDHFYSIWLLWWFRTRDIFDWNSIECKVKHIQLQLRT